MELLKNWISTLCIVVVIVSIAHIILPNSSIKKHVKFTFSLIILSVMLAPILNLLTFNNEVKDFDFSYKNTIEREAFKEERESFYDDKAILLSIENNLEKALKDEFYEKEFLVSLEGEVSFDEVKFNIKKANIKVLDNKKIKKVEKIKIGDDLEKKEEKKDAFLSKVEKFVEKELEISNENINVFYE